MVPATGPANAAGVIVLPLQAEMLAGKVIVGFGLTVIVNVCAVPVQVGPEVVGTTVTVAFNGVVPVFNVVNEAILPVPDPARPSAVEPLFVHVNVVPLTAPVKLIAEEDTPVHST